MINQHSEQKTEKIIKKAIEKLDTMNKEEIEKEFFSFEGLQFYETKEQRFILTVNPLHNKYDKTGIVIYTYDKGTEEYFHNGKIGITYTFKK